MADLSLRMLGDAKHASSAFSDMGAAALAAGKVIKDFAADCVKAFGESERVSKQLARAAGENTEAFEGLADSMSKQFAVEDEQVKKMQTLLLSYGALPSQVEATTRAILDFSAATGQDAVGATMQFTKGIESGTGALGRMGVHFDATGDRAKDTAAAIEALGKKFGGAAAADADTLEGRTRAAGIAWGELKEAVGGFFATIESKTGVMKGLTNFLQDMQMGPMEAMTRWQARDSGIDQTPEWKARLAGMDGSAWKSAFAAGGLSTGPALVDPAGGGGRVGKEKKKKQPGDKDWTNPFGDPATDYDLWLESYREYEQRQLDDLAATSLKIGAQETQQQERDEADRDKHYEERRKEMSDILSAELDMQMKADAARMKEWGDGMKAIKRMQEQEMRSSISMWVGLGQSLGQSLIQGIFSVLRQGGEKDTWKEAGEVTFSLFNAFFSAMGYGWMTSLMGSGMQSGNSGASTGSMFASAAGSMGGQAANSWGSKHTGGWIERFHRGGWPAMGRDEQPIIAQTGERMLSRREVAAMGGRGAVDSAARGGGGGQAVVIQAFDSSSIVDFFGDRGARGMLNAARANVGPLRIMFGAR